MKARPYQTTCIANVAEALSHNPSTLAVSATGTGKTVIFNEIAWNYAKHGKRVLILAHREELVSQAAARFHDATGMTAAVEMAERHEALKPVGGALFGDGALPLVVVASVQSLVRRIDKFPRDHFAIVIIDEAHHGIAKTYTAITDHFQPYAKLLGVTATPDRGDKLALGQQFASVAFEYRIKDAVDDGWLVPVVQKTVQADKLDLRRCRTVAGDLNAGDLEAALMEMEVMEQVAGPTVDLVGNRPTIVFAVTVAHAYALAEVIRGHTSARVEAMDGNTDGERRREVVDAFRRGEVQFLINCALFTEGFDAPTTAAVVMARPTKSRALYEQMLGRGTRPLAGCVDPLRDAAPAARRAAIAASGKPDVLVLDFAGNAGKHSLANAFDVLAGKGGSPEAAMAKKMVEDGEHENVLEALKAARAILDRMELERARAEARKAYKVEVVDPFVVFGVANGNAEDSFGRPITPRQKEALENAGVVVSDKLDAARASLLLTELFARREAGLCTYKQGNRLIKSGVDPQVVWTLPFAEASQMMTELATNRWRTPDNWHDRYGVPRKIGTGRL